MPTYNTLAALVSAIPPQPKPKHPEPLSLAYNCHGCRYTDPYGLICDVCIRKILDEQAEGQFQRSALFFLTRLTSQLKIFINRATLGGTATLNFSVFYTRKCM